MHESKLLESGSNLGGTEEEEVRTLTYGARGVSGSSYLGGFIDSTDGSSFPGYRGEMKS